MTRADTLRKRARDFRNAAALGLSLCDFDWREFVLADVQGILPPEKRIVAVWLRRDAPAAFAAHLERNAHVGVASTFCWTPRWQAADPLQSRAADVGAAGWRLPAPGRQRGGPTRPPVAAGLAMTRAATAVSPPEPPSMDLKSSSMSLGSVAWRMSSGGLSPGV